MIEDTKNNIKDVIKNTSDAINDRLKNPFIAAFFLSWILINWKIILLLLFSDTNIENKIKTVEENYASINNNFWFPLLFAIFYVNALPYLMWLMDSISFQALKGRKNHVTNLLLLDLKSKQKLAEEEDKLENIKASYRTISDQNLQIDLLKQQLEDREQVINDYKNELENREFDYPDVSSYFDENQSSNIDAANSAKSILSKMDTYQKQRFVSFCDMYIFGTNKLYNQNTQSDFIYFKTAGLVQESKKRDYELTTIGILVYHTIKFESN